MNEEKLQKFAIKLSNYMDEVFKGYRDDSDMPQEVYNKLTDIFKRQKDFFKMYDKPMLLKFIIYVYSYNTTGNFKLSERILNNLFFAGLFSTEGEKFVDDCGTCGGDGRVTCDICSGSGSETCDDCEGRGEVECPECDGLGVDGAGDECNECEGRERVTCNYCDGDGNVSCSDCSGNGDVECDSCDGNGTVETDEEVIYLYDICCWDPNLKNRCEMNSETKTPVISLDGFNELRSSMIILDSDLGAHANLNNPLPEPDMVYCSFYDDDRKLYISPNMKLKTSFDVSDLSWWND